METSLKFYSMEELQEYIKFCARTSELQPRRVLTTKDKLANKTPMFEVELDIPNIETKHAYVYYYN